MQKALNPAGQGEVERAGCEGPPASVRGEPPESACAAARHCRSFRAAGPHRAVAAPRAPDDGELAASFDGRSVTYGFGQLDILVPACAATIHKSQSEYAAVVIPVMTPEPRHITMESALYRRHPVQEVLPMRGWSCNDF
jgi:exodeoxyribonuclease V alpha subunit